MCLENHTCQCSQGYVGVGCEQALCPDDCNSDRGHGYCTPPITEKQTFCLCEPGYYGDRCSLGYDVTDASAIDGANVILPPAKDEGLYDPYVDIVGDKWHWLWEGHAFDDLFTPRTSHGTVYIPSLNKVYIFGGYDLNNVLGDLILYDIENGTWLKVGDPNSEHLVEDRLNSRRLTRLWQIPSLSQIINNMYLPDEYPPLALQESLSHRKDSNTQNPMKPFTALPAGQLLLGTTMMPQNFTFTVNTKNTVSVKLRSPINSVDEVLHDHIKIVRNEGNEINLLSQSSGPKDKLSIKNSLLPNQLDGTIVDKSRKNDQIISQTPSDGSSKEKRDATKRSKFLTGIDTDHPHQDIHLTNNDNKINGESNVFGNDEHLTIMKAFIDNSDHDKHERQMHATFPWVDKSIQNPRVRQPSIFLTRPIHHQRISVDDTSRMDTFDEIKSTHHSKKMLLQEVKSRSRRMVPPGSDLQKTAGLKMYEYFI